jgi:uncharacterized membrane protein YeaQ/YmgE (transglycosylase-associated protein family)
MALRMTLENAARQGLSRIGGGGNRELCGGQGTNLYGLRLPDEDCTPKAEHWAMGIIWTIIIGFVAGIIAKFLHPGSNEPAGFVLTTILGVVGAIVATYLGQAMGWYGPGQGAGLIGAVVGAVIVLMVWGFATRRA